MTNDPRESDDLRDVPDPSGPPEPVSPEQLEKPFNLAGFLGQVCVNGLAFVAACGALLLLSSVGVTRTAGATRSSKLKWQEREAEIDAAQQQRDSEAAQS